MARIDWWVAVIVMDGVYDWTLEFKQYLDVYAVLAAAAYQAGGWWTTAYGPQ